MFGSEPEPPKIGPSAVVTCVPLVKLTADRSAISRIRSMSPVSPTLKRQPVKVPLASTMSILVIDPPKLSSVPS